MKRTHLTVVAIVAVLLIGGATAYLMAHASASARPDSKAPMTANKDTTTPPNASTTVTTPDSGTAKSIAPSATAPTTTPSKPTATSKTQPGKINGQRQNRPQMSEGMRAKFMLMRLVMGLPRLDEEKKPLSAAQAKELLAVITPLRKQKTLSADEASKALDRVKAILSSEQVEALSQFRRGPRGNGQERPQGEGMRRPNGPGMGRPDGEAPGQPAPRDNAERRPEENGERPTGNRAPEGRPEMREDMNPFNMSGDNPMAQRMQERMDNVFTLIEDTAK